MGLVGLCCFCSFKLIYVNSFHGSWDESDKIVMVVENTFHPGRRRVASASA